MSGRLVILPKKSWNVWNIENREKVLKDEREHREQLQAAADKSNKLIQEQTLNVLRNETADSNQVTPFRLFADIEAKVNEDNNNAEYMKEKKQKELLAKKREGIADWEFGEGSHEVKKMRPWYESANPDLSKVPPPEIKAEVAARELQRKIEADPMAQYVPKPKEGRSESDNIKHGQLTDRSSSDVDRKSHKKDKKSQKEGKHKRRDKELEALQKQAELDAILQELRRRGLDSLAPQAVVSKTSTADKKEDDDVVDSRRYSQQYNPQIAKHRKTTSDD